MTWCTNNGDEHRYRTTFDDGELWQGVCDICGAEGEEDRTPTAPVETQEKGDQ